MGDDEIDFTDFVTSWPSEDDNLLNADPDWSMVAVLNWPLDPWLAYAGGYRQAANIIHDRVAQTGHDQDFLIWPFLMCWRHHVELQLKNLIVLTGQLGGQGNDLPGTHRISVVWDRYKAATRRAGVKDTSDARRHTERVLLQLDKIDPTAELTRYPVDRSGAPLDVGHVPRVHIGTFNAAMEAVANYLDAVDTMIREMINTKQEIADQQ